MSKLSFWRLLDGAGVEWKPLERNNSTTSNISGRRSGAFRYAVVIFGCETKDNCDY